MSTPKLIFLILLVFPIFWCNAQTDSLSLLPQKLSDKYLSKTSNKIGLYKKRVSSKTEKTLTKLSRWEDKIKSLLEKASPETASRLFAPGQPTFKTLLLKLKQGEQLEQEYRASFNGYRDKLNSSIKYIEQQKASLDEKIDKASTANRKLQELDTVVSNSEALEKFIRERKRALIRQSMNFIGKNKYLKKINKEAYYYSETLRNYKEIFSDPKKIEEAATRLLRTIPGFEKFAAQNSQLSGLFASPGSFPVLSAGATVPIVNGLPTRTAMQQFMQSNVPTMANANMAEVLKGNVSDLKSEIEKIKGYASGGNMNNDGLPDFKPNSQKAKPFSKRLEYITDIQFGKSNVMLPSNCKVALGIGYKFTDKNSAGFGLSYALGMGRGWDSIRFSHQGLGFRTYLKTKLKKGFAVQGGAEWNYNFEAAKMNYQPGIDKWQRSALLGLSKSMSAGKKAKTNIQIYYDFLHSKQVPASQPFFFRYGYSFGDK